MTIDNLTTFFGWCALINMGFLFVSTLAVLLMKNTITAIHGELFGIKPETLPSAYFEYLANYKILTIVLSIVPYIALKLMA